MMNVDCLKLDEVNSWKNRLNERLRDITEISDFNDFLADERLQTFLNTKLKDLVKVSNDFGLSYKYLINEELWDSDLTLKDYLKLYYIETNNSPVSETKLKIFVSEDNMINGLVMLEEFTSMFPGGHKDIRDIGILSFDISKNNVVIIRDICNLLSELIKTYGFIKWECYKDNPACETYKKFCDKFDGEYYESLETKKLIKFQLIGNSRKFKDEISDLKIRELRESLIRELVY